MSFVTIFSFFYSIGQISLGLLVHPYQTMQMLVSDKVFVWLSLLPTLILAGLTGLWRIGIEAVVEGMLCRQNSFVMIGSIHISCTEVTFFTNWVSFFMIFWQILLLYLLFRFYFVFRD